MFFVSLGWMREGEGNWEWKGKKKTFLERIINEHETIFHFVCEEEEGSKKESETPPLRGHFDLWKGFKAGAGFNGRMMNDHFNFRPRKVLQVKPFKAPIPPSIPLCATKNFPTQPEIKIHKKHFHKISIPLNTLSQHWCERFYRCRTENLCFHLLISPARLSYPLNRQ